MHKQPRSLGSQTVIFGIIMLLGSSVVTADVLTVPNNFVPNTAATADSVNQNFDAVEVEVTDNANDIGTNAANISTNASGISTNASSISTNAANISTNASDIADLDSRVSSFETDFSGYSSGFSAEGAPKNVVVLARDAGGGDTIYSIRSRYENSTEQVSIDGVLTVRPFIANYASVYVDDLGNVLSIDNYLEAPDTSNYITYNIEQSTYDVNTLVKTVIPDGDIYRETWTCSGNTVLVCYPTARLNNGDFAYVYDWSANRQKGGPFEINGFTFNDVRLESYTGTGNFFRVRANGIGEIFRRNRNSDGSISERSLIYYQANGVEGGAANLVGTPFESGGPLEGLFF